MCSQTSPTLPQRNVWPEQGSLGHHTVKTDTPLTFELTGLLGQLLYFTNKALEAQSIKVIFLFKFCKPCS